MNYVATLLTVMCWGPSEPPQGSNFSANSGTPPPPYYSVLSGLWGLLKFVINTDNNLWGKKEGMKSIIGLYVFKSSLDNFIKV